MSRTGRNTPRVTFTARSGRHPGCSWKVTSCLCSCHFEGGACDEKSCKVVAK